MPKRPSYKDVITALQNLGFEHVRTKGSHQVWKGEGKMVGLRWRQLRLIATRTLFHRERFLQSYGKAVGRRGIFWEQ